MKTLQIFIKVAELGSFSKAAEHFGMSQPAISKQIDKLEAELGTLLIKRSTRQLVLTAAGELYLHRARDIVAQLDKAKRDAQRQGEEPPRALKISTTSAIADTVLIDAICAFEQDGEPFACDIQIESLYSYKDSMGLEYDLYLREGELRDSQLICRKLVDTPYGIYGSPEYLERHPPPKVIDDLRQHRFVGLALNDHQYWMRWLKQDKLGITYDQCILRSNDTHVLVRAAEQGTGLALLPYYLAKGPLNNKQLLRIDFEFPFESMPLFALYHSTKSLGVRNERFLNFLAEYCREYYLPN